MKAIKVSTISLAQGKWKWTNTRIKYRVALVDTGLPHRQRNYRGCLEVIWESRDVTLDYEGGEFGYVEEMKKAHAMGQRMADKYQLPLIGVPQR